MAILAIDGGVPVRPKPLRGGFHGSAEIDDNEIGQVLEVLKGKLLFRHLAEEQGTSRAAWLEAWYCERLKRKHALAVNGGTSALVAALFGVDVGPGDEVILPAYTYVATAAAIIAAGAVPVIAEIDTSLNMDPADLERKITPHTRAVVPVHMRGVPARMDEIMAVARAHNLIVVEDVAQSNGASYRGRPLGTIGDVGCFSFQQYKIITSGEGGLVVTDDDRVYNRARMQADCAARFWEDSHAEAGAYDFVLSGENYRLCELSAALVWAQRQRLDPIIARCRAVKRRVLAAIAGAPGLTPQDVPDPDGECGITLTLLCDDAAAARRFARALRAENIMCGTVHDQGIPDRHIYSHWPFMMSGLAPDRRAPWLHPLYRGDVKGYAPDQCQQSLGILGRAVMFHFDQFFSDDDADSLAEGVWKVSKALLS